MTDTEILENNSLIAKFMDFKFHPEERDAGLEYVEDTWSTTNKDYKELVYPEMGIFWNLSFHKSWDWLMPVIEKIEKITGRGVTIYKKECYINEFAHSLHDFTRLSKISQVYEVVIKFIKWHNNTLKP